MDKSTDVRELTIEELGLVSGGQNGHLGTLGYALGRFDAAIAWPGAVDGVDGVWSLSSDRGLSRHPV